jgi:hypothetical protein
MKLTNEMPELISPNWTRGSNLPSIKAAIALLNAPEELQAEIKEQLAQGKTFTEAEIKAAAKQRKTLCWHGLMGDGDSIRFYLCLAGVDHSGAVSPLVDIFCAVPWHTIGTLDRKNRQ